MINDWTSFEHGDGGHSAYRRLGCYLEVVNRSPHLVERLPTLIPDRTLPHGFNSNSAYLLETLTTIKPVDYFGCQFYVVQTKCVWDIPEWSTRVEVS